MDKPIEMVLISREELAALIRNELKAIVAIENNHPPAEIDLLGVDGVVKLTGWGKQSIYAKSSAGTFPKDVCFKSPFGKKLFFSRSALINFLKNENH